MTPTIKKQIRLHMRDRLKKLSQAERDSAGIAVAKHLEAWLSRAPALHAIGLFVSLPDELNTLYLEKVLQKKCIQRYVPWITPTLGMVFVDIEYIKKKGFGADCYLKPLPKTLGAHDRLDISALSAIFVPGLAFDQKGGRLGRGQGHYDQALSSIAGMAQKPLLIGLAMDVQIVAQVPLEEHDVFMDYLCTPSLGLCKII